ncbi:uncharacterized protein LOC141648922 [Silene latifolia]|uniref:uncharacterized protein LOC141648922 n=1 Tax=Silene latifolia TaxID=37657 RepID=UPI003D7883A4
MTRDMNLREWIEEVIRALDQYERVIFMTGCWAIWERRNKAIFEDEEWRSGWVIKRVRNLIVEMEGDGEERGRMGDESLVLGLTGPGEGITTGRGEVVQNGWRCPGVGVVKINVDASLLKDIGVGWGLVCRGEDGMAKWTCAIQVQEKWEPEFAEAMAILHGLIEARRAGEQKIIIETDCQRVINAVKSRKRDRSDISLVYEDIFNACIWFDSVSFCFVCRKLNKVAHRLAHFIHWEPGRRVWGVDVPLDITFLIVADLRNE